MRISDKNIRTRRSTSRRIGISTAAVTVAVTATAPGLEVLRAKA